MMLLSRDYFYDKVTNNVFYFCRDEYKMNHKKKNYVEDMFSTRRIYYFNAIYFYLDYRKWTRKNNISRYFTTSNYDQERLKNMRKRYSVLKLYVNDIFRTEKSVV